MIGRTILHYKMLKKLGEGGMGIVYLAEDTKLERKVAIKFLPHTISTNSEDKERFKIEAKAAAALNHPSIATIYAFEEEDDDLFISMEYIEGIELKDKIKAGQIEIDEIIGISIQIVKGLQAAHEKGIVHRDIKPSNIMVNNKNQIKIMDFGLAKMSGSINLTRTDTTIGTVAYMSPEQISGEKVDYRTDIWSFGVVLFEMLTGKLPFRGEYEPSILYSIVNEEPLIVTQFRSDIPEELQTIVDKALQKNTNARYQSVTEILNDLQSCLAEKEYEFKILSSHRSQNIRLNNLPVQLTSFVGRNTEIIEIKNLLSKVRLLTLIGPGGTGKTRLAIQAASDIVNEFENGIFFIPLASVNDPKVVAQTIAQSLEVKVPGEQSAIESLKLYLKGKQMLLILDNYEQILSSAVLISELLASCSKLKVLVTSRAPLHISGEQEFPVPPLSLPDLKEGPSLDILSQIEAIKLFVQRAQAVKHDFKLDFNNASTVADICIRLDGLPLAIELAAARIKLLSPEDMLPRLENSLKLLVGGPQDLPNRQQTLKGAIEWSYDLLNEDEKKLFRRLAVFTGGFNLKAAEDVCNAPNDMGIDILEGIASLVNKSLVKQSDQSRFLMLETIREFALENLNKCGELENCKNVHRDLFLKFSEEAETQLKGSHQKDWLEKLDKEHDNLRIAFDWTLNKDDINTGMRFGASLWRYWLIHGFLTEGRERLANLLTKSNSSLDPEIRAKVLNGAGILAQNQADYPAAQSFFEESLSIHRKRGNKQGIAGLLNNLGWIAWRLGNYAEAKSLSKEGLILHKEMNNNAGIATSLNNLGFVAHHQGDYAAAQSSHYESLMIRRKLDNKRSIAFSLSNLGWALQKQCKYDQASEKHKEALALLQELGDKQLFAFAVNILAEMLLEQRNFDHARKMIEKQSLPIVKEIGSKYGITFALTTLGDIMLQKENYNEAKKIHEENLEMRKETKEKWCIAQSLHRLGEVFRYKNKYNDALIFYKESLVLRGEMEDKMGIVECLESLAHVACKQNKLTQSLELLNSAKILRKFMNAPLSPRLQLGYENTLNAIQAGLEKQKFEEILSQSRSMTLDQTITFALSEV